jgi:hypothetical protein
MARAGNRNPDDTETGGGFGTRNSGPETSALYAPAKGLMENHFSGISRRYGVLEYW